VSRTLGSGRDMSGKQSLGSTEILKESASVESKLKLNPLLVDPQPGSGLDTIYKSLASDVYTFDKSPDYIRDKVKLQQIATMLPSAKIVVMLRDPVVRAISGSKYMHKYSDVVIEIYAYVFRCSDRNICIRIQL
jgi:sulfur transfer complex TusBCD TusB component (DsrH family)